MFLKPSFFNLTSFLSVIILLHTILDTQAISVISKYSTFVTPYYGLYSYTNIEEQTASKSCLHSFSPLSWWKNIAVKRYLGTNPDVSRYEMIKTAQKMITPFFDETEKLVPKEFFKGFQEFTNQYINESIYHTDIEPEEISQKIIQILKLVITNKDFNFKPFNYASREPIDYYQIANNFWKVLIDWNNSSIPNPKILEEISNHLKQGSNVILLSNHQTEPDPQVIHLVFEHLKFPDLAKNIIMVAGHRVRSDPLAIPFSMGCNILSVHSKKHLESHPEKRSDKLRENLLSLKTLQNLLKTGGQLIWMAPSGGRDRINSPSTIDDVSPFDKRTIELYVKLTSKLPFKTYYIPTALYTSPICPPPKIFNTHLGEKRTCSYSTIGMALGKPVLSDAFESIETMTLFCENETKALYNNILYNKTI